MHWKPGLVWIALACGLGLCVVERAGAQGVSAGEVVYGMFGPRVLGQTLQSPVQRADRGIARDAYGNILGVNRAYSGRRFPEPGVRPSARQPAPIPPQPESPPEPPAAPDEWLRTEGAGATRSLPTPWSTDERQPESASWDQEEAGGRRLPDAKVVAAGFPGSARSADSFAGRIAAMLEQMPQIAKRSPIRVTVVRETAILQGRVASKRDRELAENVVRLEPGVWDVRNELVVEESPRVAATHAVAPGRP